MNANDLRHAGWRYWARVYWHVGLRVVRAALLHMLFGCRAP